jgi:multiple sugar transport system substrate-binding protein
MSKSKKLRLLLIVSLALVLLSAVGLTHAQDAVTIKYILWDGNQLPPYQQCAADFTKANPNITVDVEQLGWNDYWTGITTGFTSGDAPDVFTDHLAKYPEFVSLEQLVDIQPLVDRDGVATDIYYPGLADLWTKDGKRYGLPKDWDTIAVAYNVDALKAAGVDPSIMDSWTWNPDDGGTFFQTMAKLTIDKNGKNALDPAFDKTNVTQYGFVRDGSGGFSGQTQWSGLAVSTGWTFNNGVWGNKYNYDDPRFIKTIQWWADLSLKYGVAPSQEDQSSLGTTPLFQSGKAAMTFIGSWQIGDYVSSPFKVAFGRLPAGPEGRKSMFNGLADSIWVGSKHQEEAWAWVKYLASDACEMVVGQSGVVFPAIPDAAAASQKTRTDKGIDVSAFIDQANEKGGTFLFPITDFGGEIATIMSEAMDKINLGQDTAENVLPAANDEVNKLFSS